MQKLGGRCCFCEGEKCQVGHLEKIAQRDIKEGVIHLNNICSSVIGEWKNCIGYIEHKEK